MNKGGDMCIRRRENDLMRCADLQDPPVAHDGDAAADAHRLVEIVGDEHGRLVHGPAQADELVLQLPADQRVECTEGFVHQQDVGIAGQRPRQADALLHATRKLRDARIRPGLELNGLQHRPRPVQPLGLRHVAQLQAKGDIVEHAPVRQKRKVLEDHADLPGAQVTQRSGGERRDIDAADQHLSRGGRHQTVDVAQQGGLAAAGQAHDAEDLARRDAETRIGNRHNAAQALLDVALAAAVAPQSLELGLRDRAEDLPDVAQLDRGLCHHHNPPSATVTASPLIPAAASLARNDMVCATSSAVSTRPRG